MICSSVLHMAIILLAIFGLPHLTNPPPIIEEPIPVELATLADKANVPQPTPKPELKPEPPKAAPPLPPAPPLPAPPRAEAPPPPPPKPPQVAALPPPPEPAPEPLPTPQVEKKPEPKPEQQVQAPPPPLPPQPVVKPKQQPENTIEKILRSVEQSKPQPPPDPAEKVIKPLAEANPRPPSALDNNLTMDLQAAVRKQIESCWNIPAGAKDAKELVIEIHVTLNQDGSVREARIVDQSRLQSDTFFRAAAESAYRAIFLCQPFKLPPEKYSVWQDMALTFNPSQIL
jgi:hypothetical protein